MEKRERVTSRTQVIENPLEGEQLFLDAMFGGSQEVTGPVYGPAPAELRTEVEPIVVLEPVRPVIAEPVRPVLEKPVREVAERVAERSRVRQTPPAKPKHYKIVSISLYNEDIERLNEMVRELKRRGHYKANKSQLIRYALGQLDLDEFPRDI
jgi:hypothetical protein